MSISDWVKTYTEISEREEAGDEIHPTFQTIEWALTGQDRVNNTCARLDAFLRNRPTLQSPVPDIRRDYDSVLGFTRSIPARGALFLYVCPSTARTLTKRVHFKTEFMIDGEVRYAASAIGLDTKLTLPLLDTCPLDNESGPIQSAQHPFCTGLP